MDWIEPNPYSPYATADPAVRHLFPTLFGPPAPGALLPTGCHELAVVPDHPTEICQGSGELPDSVCAPCAAALRGLEVASARPVTACRNCDGETRHNGLCAVCRAEAHELWQAVRTAPEPPPAQPSGVPFVALGGPLNVTPHAFCEHGDLAFAARLRGYRLTPEEAEERLDVILPRCYVAKFVGAVLAIVDHDSGPEAHARFTQAVDHTQERVRTALRQQASSRDDRE